MSVTPWSRFYLPWQLAINSAGVPIPGAKLYFYASTAQGNGGTTPQNTYSDSTLSTPNPNPVIADGSGNFGDIFLDQLYYRVVYTDASDNEIATADPVAPYIPSSATKTTTVALTITVDGNGSTPATGVCADLYVPFDCTIVSAVLQADQAGDLVVDVWANVFEVNTPPNAQDSITASDQPTLSSAQSSIDTTLTGWTTAIAADSALRFNIESINIITRFTLTLTATVTVPA